MVREHRDELIVKNKELKKENQHIKNTIKEAYHNERTQLGKSVLKQLIQNIGDINE
jgi:tartrate dehydratase alpha subunit/fumarate hydratase class I-like protein